MSMVHDSHAACRLVGSQTESRECLRWQRGRRGHDPAGTFGLRIVRQRSLSTVSRLGETDEYTACEGLAAAKPEEMSYPWAMWMMAGDKDNDCCASEAVTTSADNDGPCHHASRVVSSFTRVPPALCISSTGSRRSTLADLTHQRNFFGRWPSDERGQSCPSPPRRRDSVIP